jgi:hypothetical protein
LKTFYNNAVPVHSPDDDKTKLGDALATIKQKKRNIYKLATPANEEADEDQVPHRKSAKMSAPATASSTETAASIASTPAPTVTFQSTSQFPPMMGWPYPYQSYQPYQYWPYNLPPVMQSASATPPLPDTPPPCSPPNPPLPPGPPPEEDI